MRLRIFQLVLAASFACEASHAADRWAKFQSIGVHICPTKESVNDTVCPLAKSGPISVISTAKDRIGRTVFVVKYQGQIGFISEYQFQYDLTDQDPAVVKRNAEQRAAKSKKRATDAKARAAEINSKQHEQDEIALAAIPRSELEKDCILSAAERLPRIPGIQIISSRAGAMPNDFKSEPGVFATLVHIDAKAAGQDVTYHFVCMRGARTPSMIQRYQ